MGGTENEFWQTTGIAQWGETFRWSGGGSLKNSFGSSLGLILAFQVGFGIESRRNVFPFPDRALRGRILAGLP